MKLHWYGTAALILEEDGFRLAVDPFVAMSPVGVSDKKRYGSSRAAALKSAGAVLVTHGHFDHIYDIPTLFRDSRAAIYATRTPCDTLKNRGVPEDRLHMIAPGDRLNIGPFEIEVFQGRHCRFDFGVVKQTVLRPSAAVHFGALLRLWRTNRAFRESGETVLYDIRAGGRHLQLMGSMGLDENAGCPEGADALILPFQGTGNPAETVAPIIAALKPKRILLDHYDDAFPPLSSQVRTEDFVVRMNGRGLLTEAMEIGKIYTI